MDKKRLTAKKVRISDISNGKYVAGSKEEMKPGYVITPFGQKISRVNIIASVVDKFVSDDNNYATVTLDDGTGAISAKVFKEDVKLFDKIEQGNVVLVVGKLKEYNGETYLNCEIIKMLDEKNYENLRKLEILDELIGQKKIVQDIKDLQNQMPEEDFKNYVEEKYGMDEESLNFVVENLNVIKEIDYKPKIIELIDGLDKGSGVEMSKILELSELPENLIETAINELLASGTIFEPRPGILKKV